MIEMPTKNAFGMRPEKSGARMEEFRKKMSAMTTESAMANSPGPRPPNQTATKTAT